MVKRKVVHLSSVHTPFDIRIFVKECRTLVEKGYDVTFIVPHSKDEMAEGVQIRAISNSSGRLKRMTYSVWTVFQAALKEKGDLYHFHDPELIPAGLFLKLFRKRVIYDVHEDLPGQILSKEWIFPCLRKIVSKLAGMVEALGAMVFDGIIVVTPEIARRFPKRKTTLVQNFPLLNEFNTNEERLRYKQENIVVYIGGISIIRGVKEMVEAIALLPESLKVLLILAGRVNPPKLLSELMIMPGWNKVQYVGWLSREQTKELLGKAKVGLVTLHPVPNYVNSQPIKLYEYMSASIPVVASNFPKWHDLVLGNHCGFLVNPMDPKDIAKKIKYLIENPSEAKQMGRNGKAAVQSNYVWEIEAGKMLDLYYSLLVGEKERKKEDVNF